MIIWLLTQGAESFEKPPTLNDFLLNPSFICFIFISSIYIVIAIVSSNIAKKIFYVKQWRKLRNFR